MKRNTLLFAPALAALLFTACKKDDVEAGGASGVRYQLRTSQRTSNLSARTLGSISWTSGFAHAREIKFEAESADTEIEYKSTAHRRIDLFAPLSTLGFIAIPPGTYKEVEFKVELAPYNGEPALELRGTYNGTPVVLQVPHGFELKAENEDVAITENNGYTAITNFDLSLLTQGIPESAFANAVRTNGQILVSPSVNESLYRAILANLHESKDAHFEDDDYDRDDYDDEDDDD